MPSDSPLVPRILLATAIVGIVVAGVVVLWPAGTQDAGTAPHIGHNASERLRALDGVNATVETVLVRGNETTRIVRHVSIRPGTGQRRSRVVDGNGTAPTLVVSNGSTVWMYDRATNEVTVFHTGGTGSIVSRQGRRIEQLFNRLNVSRSAVDERETVPPSPSLVPLPVVPTGRNPAATGPDRVERARFGVRYEGTSTVSGREVYVLTVTASDDAGRLLSNYTQTLYVDTEWFFPLRVHTEWTLNGTHVETTTVYRDVTFNPGLDDSLFTFDPPEDADVTEIEGPTITEYESAEALRANVSMAVPDPDVPPSFDLAAARSTAGRYRSVSLQYSNATSTLYVSKSTLTNATRRRNATDGERVTIDGQVGVYRQIATSKLVSWSCGEFQYSVVGTGVTRDLLMEVARSVGCERAG